MKKIIFALLSIIILASCTTKNGFKIKGEIEGIKEGTIYLKLIGKGSLTVIDTAKIKDGEFMFEGVVKEPQLYLLFVDGKPAPIAFFLDNSSVKIKANSDSLPKAIIKGLKVNEPWHKFHSNMPFEAESNKLKEDFLKAQGANDMNKMTQLRDEYTQIVDKQKAYFEKFIWDNTDNVVGAYLSVSYAPSLELEKLKELVAKLKAGKASNSMYVKDIEVILKSMQDFAQAEVSTQIGKAAPDFTFTNLKGESKSLKSFKGKVILIDFWASWCRPCRAENPNVVALYKKYRTKNFDILSISLDKEEGAWKGAIQADGLIWENHHWDMAGVIANQYGVKNIPHTILIGKDGTILYKDIRGDELEAKLKPLL